MNAKCYEWTDEMIERMRANLFQQSLLKSMDPDLAAALELARNDCEIREVDGWDNRMNITMSLSNYRTYRLRPDFALEWPVYVADNGSSWLARYDSKTKSTLIIGASGTPWSGLPECKQQHIERRICRGGCSIIPTAEALERIEAAKGPADDTSLLILARNEAKLPFKDMPKDVQALLKENEKHVQLWCYQSEWRSSFTASPQDWRGIYRLDPAFTPEEKGTTPTADEMLDWVCQNLARTYIGESDMLVLMTAVAYPKDKSAGLRELIAYRIEQDKQEEGA